MDDSYFHNDRKTVRGLSATAHFIRLNQIRPSSENASVFWAARTSWTRGVRRKWFGAGGRLCIFKHSYARLARWMLAEPLKKFLV